MSSIIEIKNISKSYMISHEGREKYTALRDVIGNKAKQIFSFPGWMKPSRQALKEEFWALRDVSFGIEQGDRVAIIGRNGAGKSTLLKIISRITQPTGGCIKVRGRVASLLEVGTGFHPELTGRENVFLNGAILGMSRTEIKRKFDEIISFAEIEQFLDTPVKRYSSGMYVRLAFAVAAHLEPEILIVDEVLAVGDAQFQKKCLGKMEDVSTNEGRTVLFVSHNMGVVAQLCNKGILLSKGQVKMNGEARRVIENYLINDEQRNYYMPASGKESRLNYFESIEAIRSNGETGSDIRFNESIILKFSFYIHEKTSGLQIGIGLEDKFNTRVFTILKEIEFFKQEGTRYSGEVQLPASLIAPNHYSFTFAIWTKSRKIYDLVTGICPVAIYDTGTTLALYEGVDYGNIIITPVWS